MYEKRCTFFGHRDCPASIRPKLRETLVRLIEQEGVTVFYVGHQGDFDYMVQSLLGELAVQYDHISYAIVLSGGKKYRQQPKNAAAGGHRNRSAPVCHRLAESLDAGTSAVCSNICNT